MTSVSFRTLELKVTYNIVLLSGMQHIDLIFLYTAEKLTMLSVNILLADYNIVILGIKNKVYYISNFEAYTYIINYSYVLFTIVS